MGNLRDKVTPQFVSFLNSGQEVDLHSREDVLERL